MPEYNPKYPKPKATANARNPALHGSNVVVEKQRIIGKLYAENADLKAKMELLEKEVQRQAEKVLPLKKELTTALERAEARDQLIAHLKDENKLLRDGSQLKGTRIGGLEAQVETLEGEKKILEEKKKARQKISISTEMGKQKKRALEREREREREEKLLRRTEEDEEHTAAEKESASKIREIEEQLAELNAGEEVKQSQVMDQDKVTIVPQEHHIRNTRN